MMFLNVLVIFFTSALICSAASLEKVSGYCSKPQQSHENGELKGQWNDESFPPGKVATYNCRQGYRQSNPIKLACIEGEWITISKGQCIKVLGHCSKPQQSHENGELEGQWNDEFFPSGKVATYICPQGYRQTNPMKMACIEGEWITIKNGQCIKDSSCGPPPEVTNGKARKEKTTYLTGIGQTCSAPPVVQHGDITDIKRLSYPSGGSVRYKCENNYQLEGKEIILCRDGEWEKEPVCRVQDRVMLEKKRRKKMVVPIVHSQNEEGRQNSKRPNGLGPKRDQQRTVVMQGSAAESWIKIPLIYALWAHYKIEGSISGNSLNLKNSYIFYKMIFFVVLCANSNVLFLQR
ncbi:complement factor H-related protein 2-like isoform X2 [Pyxicephalus adspersus]|uniref:complement factor H-related protein 2-like isoform X2 n=1 Tax=Pyxicephalus adspersus TaxID=30357 RepID=UPI003B592331